MSIKTGKTYSNILRGECRVKVAIAGLGGLGSNIAMNLVRSGVDNLKIVDFDRIDESNLNRQFFFRDQIDLYKTDALEINLKRINPEIIIEKENIKIDEDNVYNSFKDCEIIVEGFDNICSKTLLLEKFASSGKLIVSANGIADYDLENVKIKKMGKNIYIVGDFEKDIKDYKTYSSKISYITAIMSNIVLEKGGFYAQNI